MLRSFGDFKTVTGPRLRKDIARMSWIDFNFLAQLFDHYAKIFCIFGVLRSPDAMQKLFVRNQFSVMAD